MLDILYDEGPLLVVNKPSGLLTQAPTGIDNLEQRVREYLIAREGRGENGYVGVPHRLDRPVSGVILFGKHSRATRRISEQLEARQVDKVYWALTEGIVEPDEGTWTDYIRKVPNQAHAEIVPPIDPLAREAILHYKVLKRFEWGTWLEIRLETGRMHQIRIQAGSRGYPILGDVQYGSTQPFGPQHEDVRDNAISLHARSITLNHPMTREPLKIVAPVSEAWKMLED
ncbi:MAG: RNA pseudouridine synthase [Planctomycetaceae bacterium]|nr:RNA pseudouridine synthase [Planctomycetaceae bacterium]